MKNKRATSLKFILVLFFGITVIYPLCKMLFCIKDVDVAAIWTSTQFGNALRNSLVLSSIATVVSLVLAFALAWCMERSGIKYKNIINFIMVIPMLIPSISHGMGFIILFGANGILTNLLHLEWSIYGPVGIVMGSVMYSFPVAYLMIADSLKLEDGNAYQAARVLGIPAKNQFLRLTCSYLRKPMISVIFATFTLIITDYGVPLMIGGKCTTLPVLMYQDVIGLLDFGKGSAIGVVLLLPAVAAFLVDMASKDKGSASTVRMPYPVKKNKVRDGICYLYCGLMSVVVIVPIFTFVLLSFVKKYPIDMSFTLAHIERCFEMSGGRYLLNSVVIALLVSVFGVVVAFFNAYLTARMKSKMSSVLHLISIVSLAIPGIVLGLSYAMAFKKWSIYGTMVIILMVNMTHFFSSPYLMMYNTLGKVNENLEYIGTTLGIRRRYIIRDVIVPQTKHTLLEMFSYFFVNCMMTISAISFLVTTKTKTVSLMITQFEAQMMLECAAFVSLLILVVNLVMKALILLLKKEKKGDSYGINKKTI